MGVPNELRSTQVVLTTGPGDVRRAVLGLQAALAAQASLVQVEVFLTLEATEWACEPRDRIGGEPVYELLDQLVALGATITCCSSCADEHCGAEANGNVATATAAMATSPSIQLIGLATLMERVASGVPTVTF